MGLFDWLLGGTSEHWKERHGKTNKSHIRTPAFDNTNEHRSDKEENDGWPYPLERDD